MDLKRNLQEKFQRFFWHGYWTDPIIFFSLVLSVIVNGGIWLSLYRTVVPTDMPIILHYNIYFGIDVIGNWKGVYSMPTLALLLLLVNLILSRFFYYKEKLISYLFAGTALLVQLLMVVGAISIIIINF